MKRRLLSIFVAFAMVLGLAMPVSAAETAAVIRLTKTTGTVKISKSSGKNLSLMPNMRLFNGYHVTTSKGSYAWLNLDDTKLLKEDAASEVEVRQNGRKLEVKVWSGSVFFNVTEKLDDGESLNISTSTMIVGIRGTSGYVQVVDRWTTLLTVLEGTVECSVSDPVTGQIKTEEIHGGETVECVVYPQDQPGDKCDILRDKLTTDGIPGFVLKELVQDIPLCDKILDASGLDIPRDLAAVAGGDPSGRRPGGQTATPEVLGEAERQEDLDESTLQNKLDEVAAGQQGQGGDVSENKALPKQPSTGGGFAGGGGGGGSTAPTSKSGTMPLTDVEVQALLDGADSVTVQASTTPADNTLLIDTGLNVAAGKTLTLQPNISTTVTANLTVDGTMTADNITNNGTVTVNSGNTLRLRGDLNSTGGTLIVPATGRVVVDGTLSWGTLTLTPGAKVMAKSKGAGTPPSGWSWSDAADSSGYYTLIRSYTMPLSASEVWALLDKEDNVTIKANTDDANTKPNKNELSINGNFTLPAGKSLTLERGIKLTVEDGQRLTVEGALTVEGDLTYKGILAVPATGRVVVNNTLSGVTDGPAMELTPGATVMTRIWFGTEPKNWETKLVDGYFTLVYTDPYLMPLTAAQVQALLDKEDNVTIKANTDTSQNTLTIDRDLTVAAGKALTLEPGINITMEPSRNITIGGTMTADSIDNQSATAAVTDGGSLHLRGDYTNHSGILKVSATGQVVVDGILNIGSAGASSLQATPGATVQAKTVYGSSWGTYWHWSDADASGYRTFTYAPPPFSVTFDANNGTFPPTDSSPGAGTAVVTTETDGTIPASDWPTPTRDGYVFEGWYTIRSAGTKREPGYAFIEDTTLYAHWRDASAVTYPVTFDANGGTFQVGDVSDAGPSVVQTGEDGKIPTDDWPVPTWEGHTFQGWFTAASGGTEVNSDNVFTAETQLYAHWSGYSYDEATKTLTLATAPAFNPTGDAAFWSAHKALIEKVIILDGVESIGNAAFAGCTNLASVEIPGTVTSIGSAAFGQCANLTSVTLSEGIKRIGDSAFASCTGLTSIVLPNSVTTIENGVFSDCTGLVSVTIPNGVSTIGSNAFYNCSALESVTIPESVTSIGQSAFSNTGLTSVTVPGSVGTITQYTFHGCAKLTNVVLSEGITYIGERAFENCSALTTITIPVSTTKNESGKGAGNAAFYGCDISTILFNGTKAQWNSAAFYDTSLLSNKPLVHCTDGNYQTT